MIKALKEASEKTVPWRPRGIRCLFIEGDLARKKHLDMLCQAISLPATFDVQIGQRTFIAGISEARERFGEAFFSDAPLLVFVDPFGANGAPFDVIQQILSSEKSEVLINFDADGIDRIRHAGEYANAEENLNLIFGGQRWKAVPWDAMTARDRWLKCVELYKEALLTQTQANYVYSFEMGQDVNRVDYFLVFATQNAKGLIAMKEVMRQMSQDSGFRFYDTHHGQGKLMQFDDSEEWVEPFYQNFRGRTVPYEEVERWVLNETPLISYVKALLRPAWKKGYIEAVAKPGMKIREGDFPKEKTQTIRFKEEPHAKSLFD